MVENVFGKQEAENYVLCRIRGTWAEGKGCYGDGTLASVAEWLELRSAKILQFHALLSYTHAACCWTLPYSRVKSWELLAGGRELGAGSQYLGAKQMSVTWVLFGCHGRNLM